MFVSGRINLVALTLVLSLPFAATAQVTLFNTGFEDTVIGDGLTGSAPFWGPLGGAGALNPVSTMYAGGAPEGNNVGFLNGNPSLMSQGFGVLTFGTYTIQMEVGRRLDLPLPTSFGISMRSGTTILIASFSSLPTPNPGEFVTWTRVFDLLPTNPNGGFVGGNGNVLLLASGGGQVNVDNVRILFSPIPEPTTALSLMTVAGLAIALFRRRRRR